MSRRRMFPGGLRAQLLLVLCLLLGVTFAIVGLVVESATVRRLRDSRLDEARRLARAALVGDRSTSDLDGLVRSTGAQAVAVGDGASWSVSGRPAAVSWVRTRGADFGRRPRAEMVEISGQPALAAAVRDHGRVALVVLSYDEVRQDVLRTRSLIWPFFLLGAVFILVLGYAFFTFLILRPLRAIGVATQRASSGDLASPITTLPRNEFGRVGASFNQMLERLEDNRVELERRLRELQEANAEIRRTRDSLIRSEKLASVGQLAAGVAHEIGNPLSAISGYNELLLDGNLDADDAEDLLERSRAQLDRIRATVRKLLDFSRRDDDDVVEPTDLADAAREATDLVAATARARGVAFDLDGLDGPPVRATSARVVQVLVNLCLNACDALASAGVDDPRVRLFREDEEDRVWLHVCDNGPGIDEADVGRLFDPFFTTKDPGEGTGLGLAITLRIMESLGGDVEVEPSSEGACFRLTFRRARAHGEDTT